MGKNLGPTFSKIDGDSDQDALVKNLAGNINSFRNNNSSFFREADNNSTLGKIKVALHSKKSLRVEYLGC